MMRPYRTWILAALVLGALTIFCHGRAIFHSEQFAYRDAAHYYYPLYERVEREWNTGHYPPLWEPEENSGMPLLGNPTAAVLYPGKILFRLCPTYAVGARVYVIAHSLLAFLTMFAMLANWKVRGTACIFGAASYAFGGPILFQYCNIIYLVGAAWLPLGIRAVDRWARLRDRRALLQLAVVLAMEVLGGDPQIAYLTGLCGAAYVVGLAYAQRREESEPPRSRRWALPIVLVGLVPFWIVATLVMARVSFLTRPVKPKPPVEALVWMPYVAPTVAAVWLLFAVLMIRRYRRQAPANRGSTVPLLTGLLGSAVLAGGISAAQLLPVLEFTGQSGRAAGEGPHDIFPFSLEPLRIVEFLWPNPFGTPFQGNRSWHSALPSTRSVKVWVPTLYIGGLTLVFALSAAGLRKGPPWRIWMSAVALVSLVLSFGEFTSPLYWARFFPQLTPWIGPHDTDLDTAIRLDRHLRDGDGSLYWIIATLLPGFRQFRFPSKLLTFTVLALCTLAAVGFDSIFDGRRKRRAVSWLLVFLTMTGVGLIGTFGWQRPLYDWLKTEVSASAFGPVDVPGAIAEMRFGLVHALLVFWAGLPLLSIVNKRPKLSTAIVLLITVADLGIANARYVLTVTQATMEAKPKVVEIIEEAEKADPSKEPYRIHRMPLWNPYLWNQKESSDRVRDFVVWERDTVQPKYGINLGIQYALTLGVAELYDYQWFFGAFPRTADAETARFLHLKPGAQVVVYPRRAFDMWNTRYFVLPYYPAQWNDEHRGFASMIENTERIYPPNDLFQGPDREKQELDYTGEQDFQVRRNLNVYPRAWVVRGGRYIKSINGLSRADRDLPMQEILYSNELLWQDPSRSVYDPREVVWVDMDDQAALGPYLIGGGRNPRDVVNITRYESDVVEIDADLPRPGFVVLAEVFYPGWTLTIDGKDAPVYRANRLMRGAAVQAGKHKLVYRYRPNSFRYGAVLSGLGLLTLAILSVIFTVGARSAKVLEKERTDA